MAERTPLAGRMSAPLIEVAIGARSAADRTRLATALTDLTAEDDFFLARIDPQSGRTIIGGDSEARLDDKIDRLKAMGLGLDVGAPQVAYRETLGRAAIVDETYARAVGPKGEFARVVIRFNPAPRGAGYQFIAEAGQDEVPAEYLPGIEAGLQAARLRGLLAGFPVVDFTATLVGGAYHDIDSSVAAFEAAAIRGFDKLRRHGAPKLLEPVMKIEAVTPEEFTGAVIGDLCRFCAELCGQDVLGNANVVIALVPLANLFGYGSHLRAITDGRGHFTMAYHHYAPVPRPVPDDDPRFPPAIGMRA